MVRVTPLRAGCCRLDFLLGCAVVRTSALASCGQASAYAQASYVPFSDFIHRNKLTSSFDHLIGSQQRRSCDIEAERLGGLEVEHKIELGRLLDRDVGGLGAFEDFVHEVPSFRRYIAK